jgi:hypothetical protein
MCAVQNVVVDGITLLLDLLEVEEGDRLLAADFVPRIIQAFGSEPLVWSLNGMMNACSLQVHFGPIGGDKYWTQKATHFLVAALELTIRQTKELEQPINLHAWFAEFVSNQYRAATGTLQHACAVS